MANSKKSHLGNSDNFSFDEEYYKEISIENVSQPKIRLIDKEFYMCTFRNVMLNFGNLTNCRFESSVFIGCDLSLVQFMNSSFLDVKFVDCKLVGVDWTKTSKPFKVAFEKCRLNDSIFYEMDLRDFDFESCEVQNSDFEKANLTKSAFCSSDLLYCKFNGANLSQADFSGAFNYLINPTLCNIKKAKFSMPEAMSLLSHLQIIIE